MGRKLKHSPGRQAPLVFFIALIFFQGLFFTGCAAREAAVKDGEDNALEWEKIPSEDVAAGPDTGEGMSAEDDSTEPVYTDTAEDYLSESDMAHDPYEEEIESILDGMSLEDKVAQMIIPSFRAWDNGGIISLNDEIRDSIRSSRFGGILLFSENCEDAEQTFKLIDDIQKTCTGAGGLPLIVSIDEEGGSVSRLSFGTQGIGNMALAATGDSVDARTMAGIIGEETGLLGFNADYAPVMDVNNNPANPIIGVRSFSDDPYVTAEYGTAYIKGLHDAGIMATLKHFPGHGDTDTDSHTGLPVITSSYEELKRNELVPFQAGIDAGADMIMTAHIQYPEIEKDTYVSVKSGERICLPATMSRTILTDILRSDMGFEGVIVSDALEMAAVSENFSKEDMLILSSEAGVNMWLFPSVWDKKSFDEFTELVDLAVELAESGRIDMQCIDDSVRRILRLKQKYGLITPSDTMPESERLQAACSVVGSQSHRDTQWELMEKALTLVKNEDAFPLEIGDNDEALILFSSSCSSRIGAGDLAKEMLNEMGAIPGGASITVMAHDEDNTEECMKKALEASHVILVHRMYGMTCLDPSSSDGITLPLFDAIISKRHGSGKKTVLISSQLPYDCARFRDADALLVTYWGSTMRQIPPESGENSAYSPNLPAGILACFGKCGALGKLPVDIPCIEDDRFTDEILYRRGDGIVTPRK